MKGIAFGRRRPLAKLVVADQDGQVGDERRIGGNIELSCDGRSQAQRGDLEGRELGIVDLIHYQIRRVLVHIAWEPRHPLTRYVFD